MPPEKPKKLAHFNLEYGEGGDTKKYFRTRADECQMIVKTKNNTFSI